MAEHGIISEGVARSIYAILIKECGAPEGLLTEFLNHHTQPFSVPSEFRFQGVLGFGGKFRVIRDYSTTSKLQWYVDAYPEDMGQPQVESAVTWANVSLQELHRVLDSLTSG